MTTYVLTDTSGHIVNRIDLTDAAHWPPPAGLTLTAEPADTTYAIGGSLVNGTYTAPPQPAPPPPPPVTQVAPVQGRIALLNAGLLDKAQAAVNAAGGATAIWWEYATTWERSNIIVLSLASALGLNDAQVDQLFLAASQIK